MYKHADNRLLGLSELFFFLWDVCMKSVGVMAIVTAMHAWWWVVWLLCEWHSFIRYDMTTLFPLMFVLVWSKPDARWMFFVVLLFAITYQQISLTNTWVMLVAFCHGKFLCGLNKIVYEEWTASGWDFLCISPGFMFHSWWPMPVELERDSCDGKCCVLIIFLLFQQLINSQEIWPEVALSGKKLYSANSDEDEITADPTMIFCIFITRKLRQGCDYRALQLRE